MADETIPGIIKTNGPRMLPMVTLSDGKTYFFDERLGQLRNIWDPGDSIDMDKDKVILKDYEEIRKHSGRYTQFVTISCGKCGKTLFSGTEEQAKHLIVYCTECD
ncbi:MAG: hypothetical protein AB2L22_13210 [Syntrophales bacterium]